MLAQGPSALEVDPYRKYKQCQSLYNAEKLGELGTQMYLLNQWFMHYYRMRHWSMSKMAKNLGLFAARG